MKKVVESQTSGHRLSAHYLSSDSQNEFIAPCAQMICITLINEQKQAKYFSIIVDATPDSSHTEQTTFILQYVSCNEACSIQERFVEFVNCNKKTGADIAQLVLDYCNKHGISIANCRVQRYDNGSNMAGVYKGTLDNILAVNSLAFYSPCASHSLNLCGYHAAESCSEIQKFFGVVQKLYNFLAVVQ